MIVVGTGFASSFFLKKFLEKSDSRVRVLVLERGHFKTHQERLQQARNHYYQENPLHTPSSSFINKNPKKEWVFENNFGGGSNCWTGNTPRFMPNDFRMQRVYGVGKDWPLSYDELEPYYCEAEEIMSVAGPAQTPYPKSQPYPLPAHQLSRVDKVLAQHYGVLHFSQPSARASVAVGKRGVCCTSAVCRVCPVNAKFTIENSLQYLYEDPRVTLLYEAQVIGVDLSGTLARGVYYIYKGKEETVQGEVLVLGANAIFNAHILLNSGDTHPMTGKNICEQVGINVILHLNGLDHVGGSSVISGNGYFMYDGAHRKDYAGCLVEVNNGPYIRNEFGKWRQLVKLRLVFEDLPDSQNLVYPSQDKRKPVVDYQDHSPYVKRAIERLEKDITEKLSVLPIERIIIGKRTLATEYHICSTTSMGASFTEGVIDKHLIHHQYRNVFVLGSGAFPTVSPANPTLTLSALSLMAADKALSS